MEHARNNAAARKRVRETEAKRTRDAGSPILKLLKEPVSRRPMSASWSAFTPRTSMEERCCHRRPSPACQHAAGRSARRARFTAARLWGVRATLAKAPRDEERIASVVSQMALAIRTAACSAGAETGISMGFSHCLGHGKTPERVDIGSCPCLATIPGELVRAHQRE